LQYEFVAFGNVRRALCVSGVATELVRFVVCWIDVILIIPPSDYFMLADFLPQFIAAATVRPFGNVVFNMFGGEDAGRQFVGCVIAGLQSLGAGIAANDAAQSGLFPRLSLERFLDSYAAAA
jgi:hypothetical protein